MERKVSTERCGVPHPWWNQEGGCYLQRGHRKKSHRYRLPYPGLNAKLYWPVPKDFDRV